MSSDDECVICGELICSVCDNHAAIGSFVSMRDGSFKCDHCYMYEMGTGKRCPDCGSVEIESNCACKGPKPECNNPVRPSEQ